MAYIHGGGGNFLIINDKEVSGNYSSPRAVSTTDTARGLFAFCPFPKSPEGMPLETLCSRTFRKECRRKNCGFEHFGTSRFGKSLFPKASGGLKIAKTGLPNISEGVSLEKLCFRTLREESFWRNSFSEAFGRQKIGKNRASEVFGTTVF